MANEITEHFVLSFTRNVELLLQEKTPRFMQAVTMGSYTGKAAQVVKQFGDVDFIEKNVRHQNTTFSDIEHKQRWVFPKDYTLALPIDHEDELRMLDSPVSPYADAMRAAWARRINTTISDAFFAAAQTGDSGGSTTNFDTSYNVGTDVGGTASGLNIDKLVKAREILGENEALEDGDKAFIAVSSKQLSDLLNNTTVTSADFNTVKALVQGEINSFVGFEFIRYESLAYASTGVRNCPFWVKSGMHFAQWGGMDTRIGERPDKEYTTQVFMRGTIGATRLQEKKVGRIQCTES